MAQSRLSPAVLLLWLGLCVVAQCSVALFGVASRWLQVRCWWSDAGMRWGRARLCGQMPASQR